MIVQMFICFYCVYSQTPLNSCPGKDRYIIVLVDWGIFDMFYYQTCFFFVNQFRSLDNKILGIVFELAEYIRFYPGENLSNCLSGQIGGVCEFTEIKAALDLIFSIWPVMTER